MPRIRKTPDPQHGVLALRDAANMVLGDDDVLRYCTELVIERAERAGVWLVMVEDLPRRSKT
jgi:hypothetical protein